MSWRARSDAQVTGNATSSDERLYAEAGFNATLGKPFTLEALHAAIERHATAGPPTTTVVA